MGTTSERQSYYTTAPRSAAEVQPWALDPRLLAEAFADAHVRAAEIALHAAKSGHASDRPLAGPLPWEYQILYERALDILLPEEMLARGLMPVRERLL